MTKYLEFKTESNGSILIEVDNQVTPNVKNDEVDHQTGPAKVGLIDFAGKAVSQTKTLFENAVKTALHTNVEAFYSAIQALPNPPSDVEITFGLKAVGELGNVAIGKLNAESNYSIKLTWKPKA